MTTITVDEIYSQAKQLSSADQKQLFNRLLEDISRKDISFKSERDSEIICKLRLQWSQENQVGLVDGRLVFGNLPASPGLYRVRVRYQNDTERRYIGETENLRRRFAQYRNPGPTQKTNTRLNGFLRVALIGGEAVSLSLVVEMPGFL